MHSSKVCVQLSVINCLLVLDFRTILLLVGSAHNLGFLSTHRVRIDLVLFSVRETVVTSGDYNSYPVGFIKIFLR